MTDATATTIATQLIAHFEGCRLTPYLCPAGVWTIGYGNTRLANGSPVTAKTPPITQDEADELLAETVQTFRRQMLAYVKVPLNAHQEGALTSLVYNIGIGNFSTSELLKLLNAGDTAGAADQFLRWNRAAGKVLPGLTRRREAEQAVFLGASVEQALGEV